MSKEKDERQLAALILAAGKGTRMGAERAKVLHRLHGNTMLDMVLRAVRDSGADPIVVIVGFDRESVIRALPGDVAWVNQKEQLGTGHAVLQAESVLSDTPGDILVLYGDVPLATGGTLKTLVAEHRKLGVDATLVSANVEGDTSYGRVVRAEDGAFERIVERKDASEAETLITEINTGLYCFRSEILFTRLKQVTNENEQGEYYLTDVFEIIKRNGGKVGVFTIPDAREAMGVDTLSGLEEAEKLLSERERKA
ncbi:MAG: NTP transferase domain-containing protein [Planctomycetes bacterium]|nr:NTP transferase domain-containing protein [Planctomycetota bacterium]